MENMNKKTNEIVRLVGKLGLIKTEVNSCLFALLGTFSRYKYICLDYFLSIDAGHTINLCNPQFYIIESINNRKMQKREYLPILFSPEMFFINTKRLLVHE